MKGFTLVETLITITIFALIVGVISSFVVMTYRTYGYVWEQSIAVDEARKGIQTMVKEIRKAKTGEGGTYVIEGAQGKEFVFYS